MEVVILDGAAIDGFKLADHRIGVTAKVVGVFGVDGADAVAELEAFMNTPTG